MKTQLKKDKDGNLNFQPVQPQHTQGEWNILNTNEFIAIRNGSNVYPIALLYWNDKTDRTEVNQKANAQRIVKCVKSEWKIDMHDELVSTLAEMKKILFVGTKTYCEEKNNPFATVQWIKKIEELLKQAEQK